MIWNEICDKTSVLCKTTIISNIENIVEYLYNWKLLNSSVSSLIVRGRCFLVLHNYMVENFVQYFFCVSINGVVKKFLRLHIRYTFEQFANHFLQVLFKVACTSGPIFEKNMKRYPIFSLQIINYQIDLMHK